MLKDLPVFIGDCNSHGICSLLSEFLSDFNRFVLEMSARDQQPFSVDQRISDFFPCAVVNGGNSRPGDIHPGRAGFLCQPFMIQESECLKFVNSHQNSFSGCGVIRREASVDRKLPDPSAPDWSWHKLPFLTFVENSINSKVTYVNNQLKYSSRYNGTCMRKARFCASGRIYGFHPVFSHKN